MDTGSYDRGPIEGDGLPSGDEQLVQDRGPDPDGDGLPSGDEQLVQDQGPDPGDRGEPAFAQADGVDVEAVPGATDGQDGTPVSGASAGSSPATPIRSA